MTFITDHCDEDHRWGIKLRATLAFLVRARHQQEVMEPPILRRTDAGYLLARAIRGIRVCKSDGIWSGSDLASDGEADHLVGGDGDYRHLGPEHGALAGPVRAVGLGWAVRPAARTSPAFDWPAAAQDCADRGLTHSTPGANARRRLDSCQPEPGVRFSASPAPPRPESAIANESFPISAHFCGLSY